MSRFKGSGRRAPALAFAAAAAAGVAPARTATAATTQTPRAQVKRRGDVVPFGDALGAECDARVAVPRVEPGTLPSASPGAKADIFCHYGPPARARAEVTSGPANARGSTGRAFGGSAGGASGGGAEGTSDGASAVEPFAWRGGNCSHAPPTPASSHRAWALAFLAINFRLYRRRRPDRARRP
jgi:hypothetical protein